MTFFSYFFVYTLDKGTIDMAKRFKSKRKLKFGYKILFCMLIILSTFLYVFDFLYNKFLVM